MKKTFLLYIFLWIAGFANAIVVQKFYLKNGSVLYGYIQRQDTLGNYTVHADSAIINLVDARLATKEDTLRGAWYFKSQPNDKVCDESELKDAWKQWAEKNNQYKTDGTKKAFNYSEISYIMKDQDCFDKVKVLERGARVKFLTLTEREYKVTWNDILSIKGDRRPSNELSGINRVYVTKDGKVHKGQFAEETENTLGLYIDDAIQNFNVEDVVQYLFEKNYKDQDIFEQAPLIEVVYGKDGKEEVARGIIVEQNYRNESDKENYIVVLEEPDRRTTVKLSDLSAICREENKTRKIILDYVLPEGEVQIDRQETKKLNVTKSDNTLYVDSITPSTVIKKDSEKFDVEYGRTGYSSEEDFRLIKVNTKTVKKRTYYYMTFEDLATAEGRLPIKTEMRPSSVKAEFKTPQVKDDKDNIYALYNSREEKAIIITVE